MKLPEFAGKAESDRNGERAENHREDPAGEDGVGGERPAEGEQPVVQREFGVLHGDEQLMERIGADDLGPARVGGFVGEGRHVAQVGEAQQEITGGEKQRQRKKTAGLPGGGGDLHGLSQIGE